MSTVGDTVSTLGVFSTPGDIMSTPGAYDDECEGYHEYTRGCPVHQGDTMSTLGVYHDECGGYHEYSGGVQDTGRIS